MNNNLVLIDTSVWIFALSKNFLPEIKQRVDTLLKENRVAICSMVKLELLGGTRTKKEFERLKSRLDSLYEIKINDNVWHKAAEMAFSLRRKGVTIPYTDILISASALSERALILHADEHFNLIAKNFGLSIKSLIDVIKRSGLNKKERWGKQIQDSTL